jgi:hypothetical protein
VRARSFLLLTACLAVAGCGGSTPEAKKVAEAPKPAPKPKPFDESQRFPTQYRVEASVVDDHLLGKSFLPGGNLAKYQHGKKKYEMFLIRCNSAQDSAILLYGFKQQMTGAKFVAHFGGFAGKDGAAPVFIFCKAQWFAGIRGLPQEEADMLARPFAARLN